jgi:hypothetical protein
MKYIITENKIDSIIDKYITSQFRGLKPVNGGKHREVWINSDKKPVIIISSDDKVFDVYVLEDVTISIHNLFSMNGFTDIQKHLINWFKEHMNIEVDEVFTFDNEGHDYVY